ncbi:hypothetical protein V6255_03730 [Psychromonas arctica]|uniref:Uncharacterized protein n=1 Tax=Psychromonas arctica TaxID=168275 RepID=A0ABU9H8P8_9GAMM
MIVRLVKLENSYFKADQWSAFLWLKGYSFYFFEDKVDIYKLPMLAEF